MTTYVALTYTRDVDWTRPEYGAEMKEYVEFGEAAAAVVKGGHALYPTATATTVRVSGGKGGDVVTTGGPYAETKEALTGFNCWSAPTWTRRWRSRRRSRRPGTVRSRSVR